MHKCLKCPELLVVFTLKEASFSSKLKALLFSVLPLACGNSLGDAKNIGNAQDLTKLS